MARYFFDTDDGELFLRDEVGLVLDGVDAARAEAVRALPEMTRDVLADGDIRRVVVTVRTADGGAIFRASLTLACEWLPSR